MLAALIPLAGASVFLALIAYRLDLRRAFLHTSLALCLIVVVATEGLSLFSAISPMSVTLCWGLVSVAALLAAWRERAVVVERVRGVHRPGWPLVALIVVGSTFLAGIALSAILAPPNTIDVLVYHMPRVVFWSQAANLDFYPTNLYQQLSMPPFHEFAMLHVYALSGDDRFVQLVSLAAFVGCIVGVSIIAKHFGCGRRGQLAAALFCLTLPNAILQGSSAKNDMMLAFWLVVAVCFATLRWDDFTREQAYGMSTALGLALLTKGTGYIYAPGLLAGIFVGLTPSARRALLRQTPVILGLILVLNAGFYLRNIDDSGRPLGLASATDRGFYRFANDHFGPATTASNLLRNATLQLVARPGWNDFLYEKVVAVHKAMGWDPNDPASTWPGTRYAASQPGNHEATAANPYHVLALVFSIGWLIAAGRWGRPGWYVLGVLLAAVLFCAYLRWQPWHSRLHLALFITAAPVFGLAAEQIRPRLLLAAVLGLFVWTARVPLLDNELRPLRGPHSVFALERAALFAPSQPENGRHLRDLARNLAQTDCRNVGLDVNRDSKGYPVMALLLAEDPAFRFQQMEVANSTTRFQRGSPPPCAVVCLSCGRNAVPGETYPASILQGPVAFGPHRLYLSSPTTSQGPAQRGLHASSKVKT